MGAQHTHLRPGRSHNDTILVSDCRRRGPRRKELRAAQTTANSVRIGKPSKVPQLTPAPFATTSPSSTVRPGVLVRGKTRYRIASLRPDMARRVKEYLALRGKVECDGAGTPLFPPRAITVVSV